MPTILSTASPLRRPRRRPSTAWVDWIAEPSRTYWRRSLASTSMRYGPHCARRYGKPGGRHEQWKHFQELQLLASAIPEAVGGAGCSGRRGAGGPRRGRRQRERGDRLGLCERALGKDQGRARRHERYPHGPQPALVGGLHRGAGARPLQPPDRGERQPADADLGPRGREQPARRRHVYLGRDQPQQLLAAQPAFPRGTDRAPRQGQVRAALRHERGRLRVALSLGARRERRAPARHAPALWPRRPGGQY